MVAHGLTLAGFTSKTISVQWPSSVAGKAIFPMWGYHPTVDMVHGQDISAVKGCFISDDRMLLAGEHE